jgi:hypothetical protein
MKKLGILIIFSVIFLSFCKTEKDCPAFELVDLQNITYHSGDSLIFENQQSDTFSIIINQVNLSQAFTYECKDLYKICPCINYAEVNSVNSNSSETYVLLRMEQSDVSDMQYFKYNILDFYFEIDFNNELQYVDQFPYLDLETITVNNVVYDNVVVYSNLEDTSTLVDKVYLTKQHGILRIALKDGTIWNKIN